MTGRVMNSATKAALLNATIFPAWVIRLDIDTDPVLVWTGIGSLDFTGGSTDSALSGLVFSGIANVGTIAAIVDDKSGSQAVKLALAGVDPTQEALRQIVFDQRRWQFRQAWMWVVLLNSSGAIIGDPVRVKTGRMDQMMHTDGNEGQSESTISVTIESHQAYSSRALNTKYSEQNQIDATDTSQNYVHDLANIQPTIGQPGKATNASMADAIRAADIKAGNF
jgi:hypothetical protein